MLILKATNNLNQLKPQISVDYNNTTYIIDDVNLLSGLPSGTGEGYLIVNSAVDEQSLYIPNTRIDRESILNLLTNISGKLSTLADFASRANSGQVPDPTLPADVAIFKNTLTQLDSEITEVINNLK